MVSYLILCQITNKSVLSYRLWDIPALFSEHCVSTGTNRGMPMIVGFTGSVLIFVCPFFANILSIGSWLCDSPVRLYCKNTLWMIQPFLGSIVFGVSVFFSVPVFETVTEDVTNKYSNGLIPKFEAFTMDGQRSIGLIFILCQAVALDLFVLVTISWS